MAPVPQLLALGDTHTWTHVTPVLNGSDTKGSKSVITYPHRNCWHSGWFTLNLHNISSSILTHLPMSTLTELVTPCS